MNLLFLDQFSDLGGAQQNLLDLLPAIRAAGWRALVGLPGNGELFLRVRALGFDTQPIACGPYDSGRKSAKDAARFLFEAPRLARQIRRMAEHLDAGLVYLNGPRLLPAAALAGLGSNPRPPVLFHAHSHLTHGPSQRLAAFALRRLNASLIGQCNFVTAPWLLCVHPERVSVIYNGVAAPPHAPARPRAGPPRVGIIGRIGPEKGQREFVLAAAHIHHILPECRFAIYGAPLFHDPAAARYLDQVRTLAAKLPVEFAGWVDDVYARMSQLDLLLVPSTGHEATTRVILEAFAAGVPVIAFPSGGIPEVLDHGVTGLLAETPVIMADQAVDLLTGDPVRLLAIIQAARDTWERRFTLDRYRCEILQAIQSAAHQ